MATPVYNQVAGRLYQLSTSGDSGVPGYWAGLLAGSSTAPPAQLSLEQAWADAGGIFLFLKVTPADAAAFADALIAILPQLSPRGVLRHLFIANPNSPAVYWQTQGIDARPISVPSGDWRVVRDAPFPVGSYCCFVPGGATLTLVPTSDPPAMQIASAALRFVAPDGVYPASGNRGALPFAGSSVGCVGLDIQLTHGTQAPDDMQRLGVMLRYGLEERESLTGSIRFIDMPLLRQLDATAIPLRLSWDPLHPLIGDRTHADFFFAGSPAPPALSSALLTNRGQGTRLTPSQGAAPLRSARFVFGRTPLYVSSAEAAAFDYHLTPDGAFSLAADPPASASASGAPPAHAVRVMLGASGAEYAVLPSSNDCQVYFQGGGAALVPAPPGEPSPPDRLLLDPLGTTAYATLLPSSAGAPGLAYDAQPLQAPLYAVQGAIGPGFLSFHEMTAAVLPTWQAGGTAPPVMPIGAYGRVSASVIEQARYVEEAALAPARRKVIGLAGGDTQQVLADTPLDGPPLAVTPQGLVALLSEDQDSWAGVLIANMLRSTPAQLALTAVGPELQAALQSNQLFFVVSNADTFMQQSSVAYQLTESNALPLMESAGVPADVARSVKQALAALVPPYPRFPNETAFNQAVQASAGSYLPQVQSAAGLLRADMEGWSFQLSPRSWRTAADSPTLMVFKFCNRSLSELARDPAAWGFRAAAEDEHHSIQPTVEALRAVLDEARARATAQGVGDDDPYLRFVADVADNPLWNGVLFLSAPVDFTSMPEELRFLAAGIDATRFYAHHVGFSVTPYDTATGQITLGQTAAFALIDYEDPEDLVAGVPPQPFGFKTLELRVGFANAAVSSFSAQVELMINRLFGSSVQKQDPSRGNNLILDGSYQRVGGAPSYSFALRRANLYTTQNAALLSVDVANARLETSTARGQDSILSARFVLSGKLRFAKLDGFDLFSYGPEPDTGADGFITFNGLAIGMSFPLATPSDQTFSIAETALSFDTSTGATVARAASLANNFPLQLQQLVGSPNVAPPGELPQGQSPADMGFTSISAPLDQTPMESPWYGLAFALDFGTLGALTGAIGIKVTLLAAWMQGPPQGTTPPVFLGLKIADSKAVGGSLPLQGVLKLGFRSFQFETYLDDQQRLNYLLRMRRFALSVLAWSFPPGNADLMLYGAPEAPRSSLGWYAAYAKDEKKDTAPQPGGRRQSLAERRARLLLSGRRKPPVGAG